MKLSPKAHGHVSVKNRKEFLLDFTSNSNQMILSYDGYEVWWVNLDLSPVGTRDRRTEHTITAPWDSFSVLMDCYYILLDITSRLWELTKIMMDRWFLMSVSWNCSNLLKEVSMILWWRSSYILLSDRIKPIGSHNKRFDFGLIQLDLWSHN